MGSDNLRKLSSMGAVKGLPRGFTAGELRESKAHGVSNTGVVSVAYVDKRVQSDPYVYLEKREPGGQVVDKVEETVLKLSEASEAIIKAGSTVRESAKTTIESITDNNRKLRDNNTKLTDSINVFLKTATKPEYAKAINDMERLASALEKIAELEKAGILNKLAAVIK